MSCGERRGDRLMPQDGRTDGRKVLPIISVGYHLLFFRGGGDKQPIPAQKEKVG